MNPPLTRRSSRPTKLFLSIALAVSVGFAAFRGETSVTGPSRLLGAGGPTHSVRTLRLKIEDATLPQQMELDIPRDYFVSNILVLPVHTSEEDNMPITEWYDHAITASMVYENGKAIIKIASHANDIDSRAELDYLMVYVSLCNDQRHEVASSVMQVAPTSEFALPIYASMVPLNTTIPRRGLTTIPMSIQDDHPHIQTWEGLSSDFVPSLNVYAVTIGNRIPVDKNDVIAFVEQFGASSYGASIQTPVMYKSLHVSINSDSIENYDDTDTMTLYESDLGGSPCQMYPWTLFKCSPVITSVTVMPMVIKDYQMNPLPCTMLEASAEKNKVKVSNMQACMDEADENEFRIEEWHIFLTYGMFAVERLA